MEETVDEVVKRFHVQMDHVPRLTHYESDLEFSWKPQGQSSKSTLQELIDVPRLKHYESDREFSWRSQRQRSKSTLQEVIKTLRMRDDD